MRVAALTQTNTEMATAHTATNEASRGEEEEEKKKRERGVRSEKREVSLPCNDSPTNGVRVNGI